MDKQREAFEADAAPYGFNLTRRECAAVEPWSEYADEETGHRWGGWQAATKQAQARIAELEAERDQLIRAVADHVTVRGELTLRINALEEALARVKQAHAKSAIAKAELAMQNQALREALVEIKDSRPVTVLASIQAEKALNQPNIAADILAENDATVLREALKKNRSKVTHQYEQGTIDGWNEAVDELRRMAAELTKAKEL